MKTDHIINRHDTKLVVWFAFLIILAFVFRYWDLDQRAMHHDESLHALYSWYIASSDGFFGSGYKHDPMMHGPLQIELTALIFRLFGDNEYSARMLYALCGSFIVVIPYFLRARLTNLGAIFAGIMLTISPTMMYFSRFARNDILVALLTLSLVVCFWRYMDHGKKKDLYFSSVILALLFVTKETAYIITAILGFYLFVLISMRNIGVIKKFAFSNQPNLIILLYRFVAAIYLKSLKGILSDRKSKALDLILMFTCLSLPLWSALWGLIQFTPLLNQSGLVLISPIGGKAAVGSAYGGGLVIASSLVLFSMWVALQLGLLWNRKLWWKCSLLFFIIWVICFSSFLTNINGIGSGVWSSLGYWLVQQEEARGGQPWYYYLILISLYEVLLVLISIPAAIFFIRRRDKFDIFLLYWSISTLVAYMIASEKMPWLLVNIILPMIILSARYMAYIVVSLKFKQTSPIQISSYAIFPCAVLSLLLAVIFYENFVLAGNTITLFVFGVISIILAYSIFMLIKYRPKLELFTFSFISVVIIIFVFTLYNSWRLNFKYEDTPVEMMIYTQTSPDITKLVNFFDGYEDQSVEGPLSVGIDGTSGFTWPWSWYMRNNSKTRYIPYSKSNLEAISDLDVILVHSRNKNDADELFKDTFHQGIMIKHRWWFPEGYRNMDLTKFADATIDTDNWRWILRYFLFRDGVIDRLGTENAYAYFSVEKFPQLNFSSTE